MPLWTRRDVLRGALAAGGSLALGSASSGCTRVTARSSATGSATLGPLRHVIIFLQENRSFDHYFGTLAGVRGFGDPHPLWLPDGAPVFSQPAGARRLWPFRLDRFRTRGQCVADVNHGFDNGIAAWNGGRMDRWFQAKGQNALSYYSREDLPLHYALADAFTVCDHYHCSINGPTNPNRLFAMTGTIDGEGRFEGPVTDNSETPPYTWMTYAERLEAAGIDWRVYQGVENFDDNALAWFETFQDAELDSPLFEKGMRRGQEDEFTLDVEADRLPAVSWIVASTAESEHPDKAPNAGAALLGRILAALRANPAVWQKTALLYSMDENGGFFDHVPPPLPPADEPGEWLDGKPLGLGPRVPTIVISPWSTGGRVCAEVFDHTSLLRLLETFTGVAEPNIGPWRRRIAGDLSSVFDFNTAPAPFPADLPDAAALAAQSVESCATQPDAVPDANERPKQETASRTLLPLPYRPAADASLAAHAGPLDLRLRNDGTRAMPLSIHPYVPAAAPRCVELGAGAEDLVSLGHDPTGRHDVAIHGVNHFHRRFIGRAGDPLQATLFADGTLALLQVRNTGTAPIVATVADVYAAERHRIELAAGAVRSYVPRLKGRWYEFAVLLGDEPATRFLRLYAGHLEGAPDQTLPLEPARDPALDPPPAT